MSSIHLRLSKKNLKDVEMSLDAHILTHCSFVEKENTGIQIQYLVLGAFHSFLQYSFAPKNKVLSPRCHQYCLCRLEILTGVPHTDCNNN